MIFKKTWKIRDISDANYAKLGDSADSRRNRADSIEFEISSNWRWLITTIIALIALVVGLIG